MVVSLMETEGGQLAEYIKVKSLKPYLSNDLVPAENDAIPALLHFDTGGEGFTKYALGLPVERFIDLCDAYSQAAEAGEVTDRQQRIAINANAFLRGLLAREAGPSAYTDAERSNAAAASTPAQGGVALPFATAKVGVIARAPDRSRVQGRARTAAVSDQHPTFVLPEYSREPGD